MRSAAVFLLLMVVGGCGDDSTTTAAGADLAAVADLAVPVDLSPLSCADILACRHACGANLVCQQACADEGTTAARALYQPLVGCLAEHCARSDGGTNACASATDTTNACLLCLSATFDAASSPTAACHTEYAACAGG